MARNGWIVVVAALGAGSIGCNFGWSDTSQATEGNSSPAASAGEVRQPAVAGLFYPDEKEKLAAQVDGYLAEVKPAPVKNLRGIIAPHAGYDYSGPVAAVAYKQLQGRDIDTVIVMAPSHYARFEGASVAGVEAYQTPLGRVPLSPRAAELAKVRPMASERPCRVGRPSWWRQASKEPPPVGEDTPHTWEHSLEVQLPFLQQVLDDFTIVPIVFGDVDPKEVAKSLQDSLDEKTVLVASSDLSHFYPYDVAQQLDSSCIRAICDLDVEWMKGEDACGKGPILTLMHLARENGWRTKLLDYRNSGDTSGDKRGVVGYAAIAFFEPEQGETPKEPSAAQLGPKEGKILVDLAAKTVAEVVEHGRQPSVDAKEMPQTLTQRRACFVTLNKDDELRGCIGSIFPREPLCRAVIERAKSAATDDPRFPPVKPEELDDLEIEVSVLTIPKRLEFDSAKDLLAKLRPGIDGVVLRIGPRQSTYLPQVWEQLADPERFMSHLSQKAGLAPDAWRSPQAMVLTYQAQVFEQTEP